MPARHWPTSVLTTTALALLSTAAATGCGNSATAPGRATTPGRATAPGRAPTGHAPSGRAGPTETAGVAAATARTGYTAGQLAGALLARVGGQGPAAPAEAGAYGTLPDVQTSKQTMQDVTVSPAQCAEATAQGFDSAPFAQAPAAVVTFRVGRDGVSEVLISATPQLAAVALTDSLPPGCTRYTATTDGKTFYYSVRETTLTGVAEQARALNVRATGYAEVNLWSVVYRGRGFVGAVTMVGPDISEPGVRQLARDADAYAGQSLP